MFGLAVSMSFYLYDYTVLRGPFSKIVREPMV